MNYTDRVYGECEITEPVILELLASSSLKRLEDIDQFGYFTPYFPERHFSRFEHSVGVFLLLRKYGAPLEEQIAGLIHDVSHSAFSHCIDYVLADSAAEKQSHQDNIFDEFVRHSELPGIIEKYGFAIEHILDDSRHPLKETELPDLCADRIDYSLRDVCLSGKLEEARSILNTIVAENGKWVFKSYESARKFAELYAQLNQKYWSGIATAVMFRTVGDYLKYALSKNYILESDLYTTDSYVLNKIAPHHASDDTLVLLFDRMNNRIPFTDNHTDYTIEVPCKSRAVDPLCRHDGKIKRVSEIDSSWLAVFERESTPKHYFLKFAL